MNIIEGQLIAQDLKIAIVVARFNEFIGSKLVGGALDGLKRHGVAEDAIDLAWVPGATRRIRNPVGSAKNGSFRKI